MLSKHYTKKKKKRSFQLNFFKTGTGTKEHFMRVRLCVCVIIPDFGGKKSVIFSFVGFFKKYISNTKGEIPSIKKIKGVVFIKRVYVLNGCYYAILPVPLSIIIPSL